MQNSSEVRFCSNYRLNEKEYYTKHGGVVISIGWNTGLYRYILDYYDYYYYYYYYYYFRSYYSLN